jgi:peptidoglycan/LPS O-acetylase OafA/YrhL
VTAHPSAPRSVAALAAATPADRDRVVDLVRAVAVTVVVVWHTTLSLLHLDAGRLVMRNPIDMVPGMWALTWALQVMPVFFVVGGYVHLLAWRSTPSTGAFLRRRARRLGRPLVPFLGAWAVAEVGFLLAGRPPLVVAAPALFTPLWFLVVYLAVAAAVPLTARWHDRWGGKVVLTGAGLLVALDVLRLGGVAAAGVLTTALVWLLCHQLGYLWRDGVAHGRRRGLLLAAGAVAGLALLTGPGPYALSMVASVAHESNMLPTTPPILLVAVLQLGLVLALHGPLARLLRRPRWWRPVVAVNALAMSIYLWHMAAALILVLIAERTVGSPATRPDAAWWWSRPLWLAAVLVVLLGLLGAVRRWEAPRLTALP